MWTVWHYLRFRCAPLAAGLALPTGAAYTGGIDRFEMLSYAKISLPFAKS
jgi:hypothetical protein